MTASRLVLVDGVEYEVVSGGWFLREPCIMVPVSVAGELDGALIGKHVKALIRDARIAHVLMTAEWILNNSRNPTGGRPTSIPDNILANHAAEIAEMREFAGEDSDIDEALAIVEQTIREAQEAEARKISLRTRAQKVRADMRTDYSRTFVKLGRRDGFHCAICMSSESDLQIDHVIPVAQGGDNDLDNLQLLCRSCNAAKSDRHDP